VLPHRHVFDFNQALMDFGATLCTARKPKCLICPMRPSCAAYPFNPDNELRTSAASEPRERSGDRRGPRE
jgi:A/G-specific adenine glycosylase